MLKTMPDGFVDMVVTSPPYNKRASKKRIGKTHAWKKHNIDYGDYKDDMPEEEYQEWQKKVLRECLRVLKINGSIFYNHKPRIVNHKIIFPHEWLGEFIIRQMIIWNKLSSPVIDTIRFMPLVEYIFWITKERKTPKFNPEAFHYKEVWEIPAKPSEHPAPFPEKIAERCIKATSDVGDLVLDPFIGSGTTAAVAKRLGRNYLGIELNPEYIKLAEERIAGVAYQPELFLEETK